jgi:hypothetical protein
MIEPVGEAADEYLAKLFNKIVSEDKVPNDWSESIIVTFLKVRVVLWSGATTVA